MRSFTLCVSTILLCAAFADQTLEDNWVEPLIPDNDTLESHQALELVGSEMPQPYETFDWIAFGKENKGLSAQLDAVNPIVNLEKDDSQFMLLFTVYNPTKETKKVLKWATPMEVN